MTGAHPLENKDVRELQSAVFEESRRPPRIVRKSVSRAAALELIDLLSRQSVGGLATIAGLTVFIAGLFGSGAPLRAGLWVSLVLGALIVCRFLQYRFRAGVGSSANPFSWRRDYMAALCVLGTAFGAGAILLGAPEVASGWSLAITSMIAAGLTVAAAFHYAHIASVMALLAPGGVLYLYAVLRHGLLDTGGAIAAVGFVAAGAGIVFMGWRAISNVARRLPRTTTFRTDPEQPYVETFGERDIPTRQSIPTNTSPTAVNG